MNDNLSFRPIKIGLKKADPSTLWNLRAGYRIADSDDYDIDYYYASRLAGEPCTILILVGYQF